MREYINTLYGRTSNDRLFIVTKSHLEKEIKRGADLAGLKQIRVHDCDIVMHHFLYLRGLTLLQFQIVLVMRRLALH